MSRLGSYLAAIVVAAALIALIVWGLGVEGRSLAGLQPGAPATPQVGEVVMPTVPRGADTVLNACVVCHSVHPADASRAAPDLYGIVGAEKASSPWFNYSNALRETQGVWTETDLDQYLKHPPSFLPGTKKTIVGIADDDTRSKIIAALKATSTN